MSDKNVRPVFTLSFEIENRRSGKFMEMLSTGNLFFPNGNLGKTKRRSWLSNALFTVVLIDIFPNNFLTDVL